MFKRTNNNYKKEIEKRIDETLKDKQELVEQMRKESINGNEFSLRSTVLLNLFNDRLMLLTDIKESVENSVG